VTGEDWLLALHLLSAVALGAAVTGFWAVFLGTRTAEEGSLPAAAVARLNGPLTVAVAVGGIGTIVFGVWLAIVGGAYHVWDGWIIAAIVLWAAGMGLGQRAGTAFERGGPADRRSGLLLQGGSTVAILVVLVLMIWKPGA
jgi:hypothetical protein